MVPFWQVATMMKEYAVRYLWEKYNAPMVAI
jgi:hypothetical protein